MAANEEQANVARRQHGRDLVQKGVHAIEVHEGKEHGKQGWVVVAHVQPGVKVKLPDTLTCKTEKGAVDVPLVTVSTESFKLE